MFAMELILQPILHDMLEKSRKARQAG